MNSYGLSYYYYLAIVSFLALWVYLSGKHGICSQFFSLMVSGKVVTKAYLMCVITRTSGVGAGAWGLG